MPQRVSTSMARQLVHARGRRVLGMMMIDRAKPHCIYNTSYTGGEECGSFCQARAATTNDRGIGNKCDSAYVNIAETPIRAGTVKDAYGLFIRNTFETYEVLARYKTIHVIIPLAIFIEPVCLVSWSRQTACVYSFSARIFSFYAILQKK